MTNRVRVRVGLTLNWYRNKPPLDEVQGRWRYGVNQVYADMVSKAGGFPVGIIPTEDFDTLFSQVDIIVITGGGDIDPALYNSEKSGLLSIVRERPFWEIKLYSQARKRKVPVFAICFGCQLVAVAEGSGLIQDIQSEIPEAIEHHGSALNPLEHAVEITDDSILQGLLGSHATVSSFHHQAVKDIPDGFRASARSSDGIPEAMESDDGLVIAVQWHPERDTTGDILMKYIVNKYSGGN